MNGTHPQREQVHLKNATYRHAKPTEPHVGCGLNIQWKFGLLELGPVRSTRKLVLEYSMRTEGGAQRADRCDPSYGTRALSVWQLHQIQVPSLQC